MKRSQFCALVGISEDRLKTLTQRNLLPFWREDAPTELRRRIPYSRISATLLGLFENLVAEGGLGQAEACAVLREANLAARLEFKWSERLVLLAGWAASGARFGAFLDIEDALRSIAVNAERGELWFHHEVCDGDGQRHISPPEGPIFYDRFVVAPIARIWKNIEANADSAGISAEQLTSASWLED